MTVTTTALLVLSVLAGACTQRVTGLGFTLVAGPLLTLLLGAVEGVRLANLLSLLAGLAVLPTVWSRVEPRRVLPLAVPALAVLPLGALLAASLPGPPLLIGEGLLVLAALAALHRFPRPAWLRGRGGAAGTGAVSGLMNVTAGIGGPAVTLYAAATGWEQRSFVACMQLYSVLLNAGSLAAKGLPALPATVLGGAAAATLAGAVLGTLTARRVPAARARQAVLTVAAFGAAGAIVKGVIN
ncbi:TSUP family transporter, partial [Streptomyces sp. NPDC048845]|uniref:TSUP family transporter n=1 Tax=Streptomyces sp. NPDC048845 TaxID=3155390 RepID=UPI00343FC304